MLIFAPEKFEVFKKEMAPATSAGAPPYDQHQ
jgi:hypothetical protein